MGTPSSERFARSAARPPTLIVSARDALSDIILGLDSGADDYLTMPFSLEELLARVRALSRRLPVSAPLNLAFEDLTLEVDTHELRRHNRIVQLSRTEFALMELLMRRAGTIVTRDALIEAGWGFSERRDFPQSSFFSWSMFLLSRSSQISPS
jgi:DNA-binding response OmpR family regulator